MKVGVIGAGTMGSGIAQAFAQCDQFDTVYLCDIKQEFADGGFAKIKKSMDKLVAKGKKTQEEADAVLAKVTDAVSGLAADMVINPQVNAGQMALASGGSVSSADLSSLVSAIRVGVSECNIFDVVVDGGVR